MHPVFITTRIALDKALEHLRVISNPDQVNSGYGPSLSVLLDDDHIGCFEKIAYHHNACSIHVRPIDGPSRVLIVEGLFEEGFTAIGPAIMGHDVNGCEVIIKADPPRLEE